MARDKYDGVVEAVHYKPNGQVDWVRTYLRRGPTFSDFILLNRETLIEHLKSGKKYMAGKRVPQLASTFSVSQPVRVITRNGEDVLVVGEGSADHDHLEGVPII